VVRVSILLIAVILIAGMVGCDGNGGDNGESYTLTITSTPGGSVIGPGEGTFNYDYGRVIWLIVWPDLAGCYEFVNWIGDVGTIADIEAMETTITMHGSYVITANFTRGAPENLKIRDWYDLDAVRDNRCGNHTLMNDLDCSTPGYAELASPTANQGKGWQPIGAFVSEAVSPHYGFRGTLDGQGYDICDLSINRLGEEDVGLIGFVYYDGVIKDIGAINVTVTGCNDVGGMVGVNYGTVSNCYCSGNVTGYEAVGGLVGNNQGTLNDSYSTGNVYGEDYYVGGLVGENSGTVSDSYSSSNVIGLEGVGGLVGWNSFGTVSKSYSTGSVIGLENVGGLVGRSWQSPVTNSFWDTQTSGQTTSAGGTGKTTIQMWRITTFSGAGWDITAVADHGTRNPACIWNIVDHVTYPFLSWQS
jgi:hypothetical protein